MSSSKFFFYSLTIRILSNFAVEFRTWYPFEKKEIICQCMFSQCYFSIQINLLKGISIEVPDFHRHLNCRNTLSIRVPLFALPMAGPCPVPFISVAGGCYQFLDSMSVTWDVGRTSCQDNGGDLAVIDDCSVMADIIRYIEGAGQPSLRKN